MCGGCVERSIITGGRRVDNETTEAIYDEFRKKNKPKKRTVVFNALRSILQRNKSTTPPIEMLIGTGNFRDSGDVYIAEKQEKGIQPLRVLTRRISSAGRRS